MSKWEQIDACPGRNLFPPGDNPPERKDHETLMPQLHLLVPSWDDHEIRRMPASCAGTDVLADRRSAGTDLVAEDTGHVLVRGFRRAPGVGAGTADFPAGTGKIHKNSHKNSQKKSQKNYKKGTGIEQNRNKPEQERNMDEKVPVLRDIAVNLDRRVACALEDIIRFLQGIEDEKVPVLRDIAVNLDRVACALEDIIKFLQGVEGKTDTGRRFIRTLDLE